MLSGGTKEKALFTTKTPRHQEKTKQDFLQEETEVTEKDGRCCSRLLCYLCYLLFKTSLVFCLSWCLGALYV